MGGSGNISATAAQYFDGFPGDLLHLFRSCERKEPLGTDPAPEGQILSEFGLHLADIVDFRLEGLIDIQADFNQIGEDLMNIPAGMLRMVSRALSIPAGKVFLIPMRMQHP